MKTPKNRGTAIDMRRLREWVGDFSGYRISVTEPRIDRWLNQFHEDHKDIAARLLDVIEYIGNDQISSAFRESLNSLNGWSKNEVERSGRWFFVSFSRSSGESGDVMVSRFRTANNMSSARWNGHFVYKSQLLELAPGPEDNIVLIDDFSGTGDQACTAWEEVFRELIPYNPNIYLVLIALSRQAFGRIISETDMVPVYQFELNHSDDIFHESCTIFNDDEKDIILTYCETADRRWPKGFGECGFVLVVAHKCPNNSLPILHVGNDRWEGLFRRHD